MQSQPKKITVSDLDTLSPLEIKEYLDTKGDEILREQIRKLKKDIPEVLEMLNRSKDLINRLEYEHADILPLFKIQRLRKEIFLEIGRNLQMVLDLPEESAMITY